MGAYREHGSGELSSDARAPSLLHEVLWALGVVALVVGAYAVAAALDDRASSQEQALAEAEVARMELPRRLSKAYEQGMSDALAAVQSTPEGMQLAQACMARGYRP